MKNHTRAEIEALANRLGAEAVFDVAFHPESGAFVGHFAFVDVDGEDEPRAAFKQLGERDEWEPDARHERTKETLAGPGNVLLESHLIQLSADSWATLFRGFGIKIKRRASGFSWGVYPKKGPTKAEGRADSFSEAVAAASQAILAGGAA